MANRDRESGHLVPWCSVKLCEVIPLGTTVAVGEVYSVLSQWMNDSKAKSVEGGEKESPVTLSNAFSVSSNTIMVLFCCCDISIRLKSLRMLSEACLFFVNPVWPG